ncbi:unnamed protein product [Protopolystoma xenopodis]|uniref:Uncharacterized protein n=1 Tax=Protopolystoma xenopodis TaxID=117903 RepID=A0A3S5BP63_9PLAT|nr:unnamed protein product [Protopolystoma xenopodis]
MGKKAICLSVTGEMPLFCNCTKHEIGYVLDRSTLRARARQLGVAMAIFCDKLPSSKRSINELIPTVCGTSDRLASVEVNFSVPDTRKHASVGLSVSSTRQCDAKSSVSCRSYSSDEEFQLKEVASLSCQEAVEAQLRASASFRDGMFSRRFVKF